MAPQYTPEQRNFIFCSYLKHSGTRGSYTKVCNDFALKYPVATPVNPKVSRPSQSCVIRIHKKQMKHNTVHNLNSKASPGPTYSGRRR